MDSLRKAIQKRVTLPRKMCPEQAPTGSEYIHIRTDLTISSTLGTVLEVVEGCRHLSTSTKTEERARKEKQQFCHCGIVLWCKPHPVFLLFFFFFFLALTFYFPFLTRLWRSFQSDPIAFHCVAFFLQSLLWIWIFDDLKWAATYVHVYAISWYVCQILYVIAIKCWKPIEVHYQWHKHVTLAGWTDNILPENRTDFVTFCYILKISRDRCFLSVDLPGLVFLLKLFLQIIPDFQIIQSFNSLKLFP